MSETPAKRYKLDCAKPSTAALLLVYGFPACVTVSLSPALGSLRQAFDVSSQEVRMVMTFAMLAYAIGPLFSAPVSMFFGRRKAILIGIGISLAGLVVSLAAALGNDFGLFLFGRVVSTFGAALSFCLAYAVISDFYHEADARKVLALIAAAFCVVPGVVMAACGQLTEYLSWPWTVGFMIGYAVLTGVLCWRLPETQPPGTPGFAEVRAVFVDYGRVISNRTFLYCAVITGLAVAALYVYATDAALIATSSLGMSAGAFGYYSLIPYLGAIISLTLMQKLGDRMSFTATTLMGFLLIAVSAGTMLFCFMAGMVNAWTIFGLTLVLIGGTMPLNVTYVTIAENSTAYRGVVASLISSIFMFVSMLAVQASALLEPLIGDRQYPVTLLGLWALLVAVFGVMWLDKKHGRAALRETS